MNILIFLAILFISFNSIGVYKMCKTYKKIKFENYVLLSGILEGLLLIIAKVFSIEPLIQLVKFLQLIILLFITRRFLKIYLILEKKKSNTKFYNYFFCVLVVVNVIIILSLAVLVVLEFIMPGAFLNKYKDSYLSLCYGIFSLLSSICSYILGKNLKKMIQKSLKDCFEKSDFDNYFLQNEVMIPTRRESEEERERDENKIYIQDCQISNSDSSIKNDFIFNRANLKERDFYFSVRYTQINIVTITYLVCDIYIVLFRLLKLFFIENQFKNYVFKVIPITSLGSVLYFIRDFAILIPVFTNFIAFYFLIRKSYKVEKPGELMQKNSIISETDIISLENYQTNRDIEQYLN